MKQSCGLSRQRTIGSQRRKAWSVNAVAAKRRIAIERWKRGMDELESELKQYK